MDIETYPFEGFSSWLIDLVVLTDCAVAGVSNLRAHLQQQGAGSGFFALDASVVPGTFPVRCAASKALYLQTHAKLSAPNLQAQVVACLQGGRNAGEALRLLGPCVPHNNSSSSSTPADTEGSASAGQPVGLEYTSTALLCGRLRPVEKAGDTVPAPAAWLSSLLALLAPAATSSTSSAIESSSRHGAIPLKPSLYFGEGVPAPATGPTAAVPPASLPHLHLARALHAFRLGPSEEEVQGWGGVLGGIATAVVARIALQEA